MKNSLDCFSNPANLGPQSLTISTRGFKPSSLLFLEVAQSVGNATSNVFIETSIFCIGQFLFFPLYMFIEFCEFGQIVRQLTSDPLQSLV